MSDAAHRFTTEPVMSLQGIVEYRNIAGSINEEIELKATPLPPLEAVERWNPATGRLERLVEGTDFSLAGRVLTLLQAFAAGTRYLRVVYRTEKYPTQDTFESGEVLADQAGAGAVLTFTFSSKVDLVWVRAAGGDVRIDPFGGTPTSGLGIVGEAGIPVPINVRTKVVKVYASAGTTVNVWGLRYG